MYRPPSEADSLLVQVTIGCAWNQCTFCDMFKAKKFRVRTMEEIERDLIEGSAYRRHIRRIFLCDGYAFVLPFKMLKDILLIIRRLYPELDSVRIYASAKDILRKTPAELAELRALGLDMVYIGLETGSDVILKQVNKGITKQQMIDAAALLREAGILQSISIIAGLGGEELWREHITETADCLNRMQPEYLGMLVLYVGSDAHLFRQVQEGTFRLPSPDQVLREMRLLIELLEQKNCYFTSAHVSNYIHVKGRLPDGKNALIQTIDRIRARAV